MSLAKSILFVTPGADPERGGHDLAIREAARELTTRGVKVTIASSGAPDLEAGAEHVRVGPAIKDAEALIRDFRASHLVHTAIPARGAHVYTPRTGLFRVLDRRMAEAHEAGLQRLVQRWSRRFDPRRRDLIDRQRAIIEDPNGPIIVATSTLIRDGIAELFGDAAKRVRVVQNGIDLRRLQAPQDGRARARDTLQLAAADVAFLAVTHDFRRGGVFEFLKALAKLDQRRATRTPTRFKAFVAGSDDSKAIDRRARELGLFGRVTVVGAANTVTALYSAADVLVHPSFYDPSGRVILEALAVRLPVIASRWSAGSEFLGGGAGRLLDEPTDTDAFAYALERFCDAAERAQAAIAIAEGGLAARVSIARHVDQMLEVYGEAAGER